MVDMYARNWPSATVNNYACESDCLGPELLTVLAAEEWHRKNYQ
jgi:hypothetical protein